MDKFFHESQYDLYLKDSTIQGSGLGVFTKDFIKQNSVIDEYVGDFYPGSTSDYAFEVNEKITIDAFGFPRCYMVMINDASHIKKQMVKKGKKFIDVTPQFNYGKDGVILTNNCKFLVKHDRVFVIAKRDLLQDEELFVYYGKDYWNGRH